MGTIPYVPTYLRATPPTIWPAVSPIDFGAIGNGQADDYPAITAALQALAAKGGGTLVFPGDRDFRIATPGVHGIHLRQQSNITIMMGERCRLIMDNMVDGLAVSHGIYVEGPCENISLIGVHVMFATMSVYRQTWAPIYFLGDNVGGKDTPGEPYAWYRGAVDGHEHWQGIEAGAVRNIYLENVTSQNSPSVGIGIVGVDQLRANNITLIDTWADGLYHVYFRGSRINGYHGIRVGDDAISMASYESDLAAADIELPFHGEGSVVMNVVLEGHYTDPSTGYYPPSGSIVPLGVRDVVFDGVTVSDRFRGIKCEPGTQLTFDNPDYWRLSLNFLANRRVILSNLTFSNLIQDISFFVKECNAGTPDKWWRHDMLISNVIGENGSSPFDFACVGIPMNGGPPQSILAGVTFQNLTFHNYASPYTTFAGMIDCTVSGLVTDGFLSIQGFVPYGFDPDLLDGAGQPMWPDNRCTFRGIRCTYLVFSGLKRARIENIETINALNRGVVVSACADVSLKNTRALFPNRANDPLDNGAFTIDEFCKRISWDGWEVEQDGNAMTAMGLGAAAGHWVDHGRVQTTQNIDDDFVAKVSDRRWLDEKISQIGRVDWYHSGSAAGRGTRAFPHLPMPVLHGDTDADLSIANQSPRHRIVNPLAADRTYILHEVQTAIGDRIEVVREPAATGPYSIIFKGQSAETGAFPVSDAKTSAQVFGGTGGQVSSIRVDGTVELLGAPVAWTGSNAETAAAIAAAINARTGTTGFTASSFDVRLILYAPAGSGLAWNNKPVAATVSGDLSLSIGVIPPMGGGSDGASAGERGASSNFLLIGDSPVTVDGVLTFHGSITSVTLNGVELMTGPVAWQQNSNVLASLVAANIMANFDAHGVTVLGIRNGIFIRAPVGHGASANGWPVVVTPTGDVTVYDVKPLSGGVDPPVPAPAGTPYAIVTTAPGAPFRALFEFTAGGWLLLALAYDQARYANGVPLDNGFSQLQAANEAIVAYENGMSAMGLAGPPDPGFGHPGMFTYDAGYLYVCVAENTWKRAALSSY